MKEGKCTLLYHCISSRCENAVLSNGRNVAMGVAYSVMLFQKFLMNQQETMQIAVKIARLKPRTEL